MSNLPRKMRVAPATVAAVAIGIVLSSIAKAEAPRVVASIKPVHALAAAVMNGVAKPYLLVKGGASPHAYSLRPSEARRLAQANLVLWIGDELESFLVKPLASLARKATVVALHDVKGIVLLKMREGGTWESHEHEADHDHGKKTEPKGTHDDDHAREDEHKHGEHDMHLWLDPHNGEAMVRAIAAALVKVDPEHARTYRRNAEATIARLEKLEKELGGMLAPVRKRRYIVFHDAYQYFEKRFGLSAVGSLTLTPERTPGAQRLAKIRARIKAAQVRCVFVEPQFAPRLVDTVIAGTNAKKGTLDPLGAAIPEGPDAYFVLLRTLGGSLRNCLQ